MAAAPFKGRSDYLDPARDKYGKPGISLPTPNWDDYIIVERLTTLTEKNWKLQKNSAHPVYNGQNGARLARLLTQTRTNGDDVGSLIVTRVYATDRNNQDAYNAAVTYTAQSTAHRIFARSSLVLRDETLPSGYTPFPALASDSADPLALCTQESSQAAEAPFTNQYLRVTRIFENFGTRAEQDAWNRRDSLPYLLATAPRITRVYRFPASYDPGFDIGQADTAVATATITSVARQDESERVRVYTCVFDSFPPASSQTGLGVRVDYDNEDTDYPRVTWRFRAKDAATAEAAGLSACPIPGYTNLKLIDQHFEPSTEGTDGAFGGTAERVYARVPGPIISRLEKTHVSRGLLAIPSYYVNDDDLTINTQLQIAGTALPALSNTILSAKVTEINDLTQTVETITRADEPFPVIQNYELANGFDRAKAIEKREIVSPLAPFTRVFGQVDVSDSPISSTQSERRTTTVDSFPLLAGYNAGSLANHFPGKYGYSGGEGAISYREQIVPTNGTISLGAGESILSRTPIDELHDKVRVGTRAEGNGVGSLSGTELGRFGLITREWDLGAQNAATGLRILSSEASPAGDGQMEVVTATSADTNSTQGTENAGWSVIPERFFAGLSTLTSETPVSSGTSASTAPGVVKSAVTPTNNPARAILTTTALAGVSSLADLPTLSGIELAGDADGGTVAKTEQVVVAGMPLPTVDYKTLSLRDEPIGNNLLLRSKRLLNDSAFPSLDDYSVFDPEYNVLLHDQHQIVAASSATAATVSGGISTAYKSIDKWRSIKIIQTLVVPSSIPEQYGKIGWRRPNLLYNVINISSDPSAVKLFYLMDSARSYLARTRIVTTIGPSLVADDLTAPIIGANIDYHGVALNISINDVLYDGGYTITDQGDSIMVGPSTPTRTEYLAMVDAGTEIIVDSSVRPYRWGFQIRETVYLTLQ